MPRLPTGSYERRTQWLPWLLETCCLNEKKLPFTKTQKWFAATGVRASAKHKKFLTAFWLTIRKVSRPALRGPSSVPFRFRKFLVCRSTGQQRWKYSADLSATLPKLRRPSSLLLRGNPLFLSCIAALPRCPPHYFNAIDRKNPNVAKCGAEEGRVGVLAVAAEYLNKRALCFLSIGRSVLFFRELFGAAR